VSADVKDLLARKKEAGADNSHSEIAALFGAAGDGRHIEKLSVTKLVPYAKHPFNAYSEELLAVLASDIKENGLIHAIVVRRLSADKYEILSGHSRTAAAKLAGMTELDAVVCAADDNEASIIVTKANFLQRPTILPSEKARAFHLRNSELKKLRGIAAKQPETPCRYVVYETDSHDGNDEIYRELEREFGESKSTIFRYMRLIYLIPEFAEMVDGGKLSLVLGNDISALRPEVQQLVYDYFVMNRKERPPATIIARLRQEEGKITKELLNTLCRCHDRAKKRIGSVTLKSADLKKYAPHFKSAEDLQRIILRLLDDYVKAQS
jgi:ParB family chromosome partitioning protein